MLHSSVINTAACFRACRQQHSTTTQAQALPASTRPAPSFHYRPRSRSSRPALAAAPKPASRRRTVKQPAHSSPAASMPAESGAYAEHLRAAADAVERAGRLCVAVRQSFLSDRAATEAATVSKADQTPVTVADFSVQALLSLELGARFPAVPLVAEEDAAALRAPGAAALLAQVTALVSRFSSLGPLSEARVLAAIDRGVEPGAGESRVHWVLDPIDGTKGFLDPSGRAQYVIGLALVDGADAVLGVMGLPNWQRAPLEPAAAPGLTIAASAGGGAWWRPLARAGPDPEAAPAAPLSARGWQQCRVDPAAAVEQATICISDHENWEGLPMARGLAPRSPAASKRLCCGSLCKYAAIALGDASAFVQHPVPGFPKLKVWDHAAGVVCVQEAGGTVTDFAGRPLALAPGREFVPSGLGVLVTNGSVHADALRAIVLGSGGGGLLPRPSHAAAAATTAAAATRRRLLVLLDRDGVMNEDLGTWCIRVEDFRLIPGSAQAVRALNAAGHATAVVTNQSCVGRGLLSLQGLAEIHGRLRELLAAEGAWVDCLLFSEDHPAAGATASPYRKPNPGMLKEAMEKLGLPDAEAAVMIGDTVGDMKSAAALGVRRILVGTGHGAKVRERAAELGWRLPRGMRSGEDVSALGGLVPEEVLPVEFHEDLASAVRALLAGGAAAEGGATSPLQQSPPG